MLGAYTSVELRVYKTLGFPGVTRDTAVCIDDVDSPELK